MKEQSNKKILIIARLSFVLIAVLIAGLFGNIGKSISVGSGVIVYDADGDKIASLKLENKEIETILINEDAEEYVALVVNEALEKFGELTEAKDIQSEFFDKVTSINTNLRPEILKKIKNGYKNSTIQEDASFASVITDLGGKVLAVYGNGSEPDVVYSDYKTYAGSAIKPLSVYAPAIQSGKAHWSTMTLDSPIKKVINDAGREVDWPTNANGGYTEKDMLLCDALHKSINTVAVKILRDISVEKSIDFLDSNFNIDLEYEKKLVKTKGSDEVLGNIALGYLYNGVSALDMAGYYQIFANGGYYTEPYTVALIEDADGVIYTAEPESKRVLAPHTASIMTQLLRGVVYPGATASEAFLDDVEVAGKSGTSDSYEDNWFVGYTPEFICSVWHSGDSDRKNKASSTFALIMDEMPVKAERFDVEGNVTVKFYCRKTGLIRGEKCTDVSSGYYSSANIPKICRECQ